MVQRSCRCSRGADAEMQVQRWLSIGCAEVQMWFSAEVMNCAGAEQAGADVHSRCRCRCRGQKCRGRYQGVEVQRWCTLSPAEEQVQRC